MVDEIEQAIENADFLDVTQIGVENILKEELTEYAQGRQTAAEAANRIASRVRLYADERE